MKTQKKDFSLSGKDYYQQYLEILNVFLPVKLTDTEIKVLAHFMAIDNPLAEYDRFNTIFRKLVKTQMKLSDAGMTNYIKALKEKKAVKESDAGILYINPVLIPEKQQRFELTLIKV